MLMRICTIYTFHIESQPFLPLLTNTASYHGTCNTSIDAGLLVETYLISLILGVCSLLESLLLV